MKKVIVNNLTPKRNKLKRKGVHSKKKSSSHKQSKNYVKPSRGQG